MPFLSATQPAETDQSEKVQEAAAEALVAAPKRADVFAAPISIDWRNVSWITLRDQVRTWDLRDIILALTVL